MQIFDFFVQLQDKINPNEQTEKETEKVACQINSIDPSYFEVQQRTVSHQEILFFPKLMCVFRAVTMMFCFLVLF